MKKIEFALLLLIILQTIVLWIIYLKFQFDLCYPEVSESIWFCIHFIG